MFIFYVFYQENVLSFPPFPTLSLVTLLDADVSLFMNDQNKKKHKIYMLGMFGSQQQQQQQQQQKRSE